MIYCGISTALHLYVHLNDGLANEGSTEEGPEGDEEMTTCDTCQVKQWVGDLEGKDQIWIVHLTASNPRLEVVEAWGGSQWS